MSPLLEETSCELSDETELGHITVPLKHAPARGAAGDQRDHRRRRRGLRRAAQQPRLARRRRAGGDGRGVHDLARAVAAADALDRRAAAGPARRAPQRVRRGRPRRAGAGARHRRDRPAGGVVQRDGQRPARARAAARGVRRVRRPGRSPIACSRRARSCAGEEVEVTVLFLDIRGFTAFAERAGAAEAVARLNEFYELVVPRDRRHGGHANKFVGDGLLAVFGAPDALARPRRPLRRRGAGDRAAQVEETQRRQRAASASASTPATVVAGTVGGGGRVEFTVIGDVVNTAARVEEATRQTGDVILITAATRALLREDHGRLEPRPSIPLKGKREPGRAVRAARRADRRRAAAYRDGRVKALYEKRDRIAYITFNRPEAKNAIDPEMQDLLCRDLDGLPRRLGNRRRDRHRRGRRVLRRRGPEDLHPADHQGRLSADPRDRRPRLRRLHARAARHPQADRRRDQRLGAGGRARAGAGVRHPDRVRPRDVRLVRGAPRLPPRRRRDRAARQRVRRRRRVAHAADRRADRRPAGAGVAPRDEGRRRTTS